MALPRKLLCRQPVRTRRPLSGKSARLLEVPSLSPNQPGAFLAMFSNCFESLENACSLQQNTSKYKRSAKSMHFNLRKHFRSLYPCGAVDIQAEEREASCAGNRTCRARSIVSWYLTGPHLPEQSGAKRERGASCSSPDFDVSRKSFPLPRRKPKTSKSDKNSLTFTTARCATPVWTVKK